MKTVLKGGTIVTMNSRRQILPRADLVIEGDQIKTLSGCAADRANDADRVVDCEGKIIIPGLISAHTHLTGMFQRGLWDESSFEAWSGKSAAMEGCFNLSPDDIYVIHRAACIELIRHGVTTVLNMFTAVSNDPMSSVDSACRALLDSGIRGILAFSLKDQSPDNAGIVPELPEGKSWISLAREAAHHAGRFGPRVSFALAPSAPQRCSDGLLKSCRELAEEVNAGLHTHLAETRRHAEIGRELYGEPIVNHLEKVGFLSPALSVAHAVWLQDREIEILKKYDVGVVHNPSSNMKLGSGVARVKRMLNQGLAVGLGADSVNAATIYSVFEQMKLSVLLPRSVWGAGDWVLPSEACAMGTRGGAKALALDGTLGSLEEGKKADLVILNPTISLHPTNDLMGELALCENGGSVESLFVDGEPVLLDRKILAGDEGAVLERFLSLKPRIAKAAAAVSSRSL